MAKKKTNLQPWLDYFKMLQQYEAKGFLEIKPAEHEAYVTRAALLTLAGIDAEDVQSAAVSPQPEALAATLSRLRAYAGWKAAAADPSTISQFPLSRLPVAFQPSYISAPFATHIVKEDYPHDLLLTLLLQQKQSWRTAWRTVDTIEAIDYTEKNEE